MALEDELAAARALDIEDIADAIEEIGFECTRCGACCKGHDDDHTATVFPDEVREVQDRAEEYDWRDVARPMPFGLEAGTDGRTGETFEWALQTDACGDCTFYAEEEENETGACTIYDDRPLICRTYPFSVELGGAEPMGSVVEESGVVRAHECEGLGRDISREAALDLARTIKRRAIREVEEMLAVAENYEPTDVEGIVVHDSEGAKHPDGSEIG